MPIKNLTDDREPAFPRIGKLKKGGERVFNDKKKIYQFGEELPYWRFVSENEQIMQDFITAYGEQPRLLNVYIPYATPDEAFPNWCEVWAASGMVHRCDGETAIIWQENGKYRRGKKACPGGHKDNDPLNDAVGRLTVVLPELLLNFGHVGYVVMETHGKIDLMSIVSSLRAAYVSNGDLRGIPFELKRVQEEISTPGWGDRAGQRSKTKRWNVKIVPHKSWVQLQLEAARIEQMKMLDNPAIIDMLALPPGTTTNSPAPSKTNNTPTNSPAPSKTAAPKEEKKPADNISDVKILDQLGNMLWPGQWTEGKNVKNLLGTETGGDLKAMIARLQKRKKSIEDSDKELKKHIAANWPGLERTIDEVKKLASYAAVVDILAGVEFAAKTKGQQPDAPDTLLVNWVLTKIPEPEEGKK